MRITTLFAMTGAVLSPSLLEAQLQLLPGGEYVPSLIGDQRQPRVGGKLLGVTEGATLFGSGIEGEASLGTVFPILLSEGPSTDRYVALGMGAGVWGRFNMETRQKHLISSDWHFRLPVVVRRGNLFLIGAYKHFSSHLGDEYVGAFGAQRSDYSIDRLAITGLFRTRMIDVYGGGTVAVNVQPENFDRLAARGGVQLRRYELDDVWGVFGGLDIHVDQNADWDPRFSFRGGLALEPPGGRRFSFVLEALTGPSPQGEFLRRHETFISLGVEVD